MNKTTIEYLAHLFTSDDYDDGQTSEQCFGLAYGGYLSVVLQDHLELENPKEVIETFKHMSLRCQAMQGSLDHIVGVYERALEKQS